MVFISGFLFTVKFHIGFLGYVIFPKAVDHNMYMDIATFVVTICMCACLLYTSNFAYKMDDKDEVLGLVNRMMTAIRRPGSEYTRSLMNETQAQIDNCLLYTSRTETESGYFQQADDPPGRNGDFCGYCQ